jgi:SAM-dependent methyltransferase
VLLLAPFVAEAGGLDADAEMLAEAASQADAAEIANVAWVHARDEGLPAGFGAFRLVAFAQSYHWMDRPRVAAAVRTMLDPGGALVHITDAKGPRAAATELPHPPPYAAIQALGDRYLGPVRRAGWGVLRHGTPDGEAAVLRDAGFHGPERIVVPATEPFLRDADDVVAWVYSLSSSAPHLFGGRRAAFEADLRDLLRTAAPDGRFADPPSDTEVAFWRASAV